MRDAASPWDMPESSPPQGVLSVVEAISSGQNTVHGWSPDWPLYFTEALQCKRREAYSR